MSAALYSTRLYWNEHSGVARHAGVTVELAERPQLVPILRELVEIDYTPEVQVARVREHCSAWRDMTADEIGACRTWLEIVSRTARAAAHQP